MARIIIDKTTSDADTRDWDHSHPLDVYSWSNYPEVNSFVDEIYSS